MPKTERVDMTDKTVKKARPHSKPITISVDPKCIRQSIVMPKVEYEVLEKITSEPVFSGEVIPVPRVMIYFLEPMELKVFSTILDITRDAGGCEMTLRALSCKLNASTPTVYNALKSLKKMGLMSDTKEGTKRGIRRRRINFEAVRHLASLTEGEEPGMYARIRKASRKTVILNLTKEDIDASYDNHVLPPDHDPAEEEEYN